jgi:hypothetical protein
MRYYFHIAVDGSFIEDEDGQEFSNEHAARKEAIEAGASIAKDAFIGANAQRVEIDVRKEGAPFLKVVISLAIEE